MRLFHRCQTSITHAFSLALALLSLAGTSEASDPCWFLSVPCDTESRPTAAGGAYPSYSDAFNINPASIPAIPTPVGLELIGSTRGSTNSKYDYNFSVLKGFDKYGFAASSTNDNTFYTYNLVQAYEGTPYKTLLDESVAKDSVTPTINLGGAVDLATQAMKRIFTFPLIGINFRYNRITHKWDQGIGASLSGKVFNVGASVIKQTGNKNSAVAMPDSTTTTFDGGFNYKSVRAAYTYMQQRTTDQLRMNLPVYTRPVHIGTATYSQNKLMLTVGYRVAPNILGQDDVKTLLSAQYQVTKKISLGYLYNYVIGAQSLGLQCFF